MGLEKPEATGARCVRFLHAQSDPDKKIGARKLSRNDDQYHYKDLLNLMIWGQGALLLKSKIKPDTRREFTELLIGRFGCGENP